MTTPLLPVPIFRAFDSAGLPLAGGLLYTYAANTLTPKVTYSDNLGASPNTNPVVLDSTGSATVRLNGNDAYKFVLKDALGTTQWTEDYYQASYLSAADIGALLYPQTVAEIAASVTPTNYAYAPGDLLRYGWSASASAATNVTAFNNACLTNGRVFCDLAGTYSVDSNLTVRNSNSLHFAEGVVIQGAASIAWVDTGILDIVGCTNVKVYGGTIDGNKANNAAGRAFGVRVKDSVNVKCYGVKAINCPGQNAAGTNGGDGFIVYGTSTDVEFYACDGTANVRQGMSLVKGERIKVFGGCMSGTTGTAPGYGIDIEADAGGDTLRDISIIGVTLSGNQQGIAVTTAAKNVTLQGNTYRANRSSDLFIGDCANVTVSGEAIYAGGINSAPIVYLINCDNVTLNGLNIFGSGASTERQGILIDNACNVVNINGGLIRGTYSSAIKVGTTSMATANTDIKINGVQCIDCLDPTQTGVGVIYIEGNNGGGIFPLRVSVKSCDVRDSRTAGNEADYGFFVSTNITAAVIADYRFNNNTSIGPAVAMFNTTQQYTGTLTGCTTSPTATILYTLNGEFVTLTIPALTATSNTTACTVTGAPASIRPVASQTVIGIVTDNSVTTSGRVVMDSAGTLTLSKDVAGTVMTSGNTKGLQACSITYRLGS